MITCLTCNSRNEPAHKFCESCGAELASPSQKMPTQLGTVLLKKDTYPSIRRTVQLKLADGKMFTFFKVGNHDVGRSDAASEWYPAVDLTNHGGQPAGVSRRHATIHITKTDIAITDLDSGNGTKQNGERLTPHKQYSLNNGDELIFGRLLARLTIIDA